jgi:hypothetical protein
LRDDELFNFSPLAFGQTLLHRVSCHALCLLCLHCPPLRQKTG